MSTSRRKRAKNAAERAAEAEQEAEVARQALASARGQDDVTEEELAALAANVPTVRDAAKPPAAIIAPAADAAPADVHASGGRAEGGGGLARRAAR